MRRGANVLSAGRSRRGQELLAGFLHGHGLGVRPAFTFDEVDRALDRADAYDAALVDLSAYDRRIWERCERMRAEGVPFFVIGPAPNPVTP